MKLTVTSLFACAMAAFAAPALAHHSFAMFDHEKTVAISGTLKEFEWTNPHAWLHITAVDEKSGRPVEWSFEMGSVGQLNRDGWNKDTVKPGDKVSVEFHPLKDGSHGGQFRTMVLPDGKRMCQSGAGTEHC